MAARPGVRVSETSEQHSNREERRHKKSGVCKALSRLCGGWGSQVISDKSPAAHTTMQPAAKVGENQAADSGKVSDAAKVSQGSKPAAAERVKSSVKFEDGAVDKEAEDYIEKTKQKLAAERLISMKRVESMLNRGL